MTLTRLVPFPLRPAWLWLAADALGELIGGILILLGSVYPDRRDYNLLCDVDGDCGGALAQLFHHEQWL